MNGRKIVLASRNEDKIRELRQLCTGLPFEVASSLDYPDLPEVIEDGTTIQGNASRKALVTAAYTGEIAVADDTALQIRVLDELPDVFASRFAGDQASYEDNARLVIELLERVPDGFRQARFVTSVVWVDPRPERAVPPDLRSQAGAQVRWLHNPFARAIHVRDPEREEEFWRNFVDRRRVWDGDQASAELDLYGGWSGELGSSKVMLDLGAIYYHYPGASSTLDYDFWELNAALSKDFGVASAKAKISYSPDYFAGSGDATYVELGVDVPVGKYFTLNLHGGYQWIDENATFGADDYFDYLVGVSFSAIGLDFQVAYVGADLDDTKSSNPLTCFRSSCSTVIASVSKSF